MEENEKAEIVGDEVHFTNNNPTKKKWNRTKMKEQIEHNINMAIESREKAIDYDKEAEMLKKLYDQLPMEEQEKPKENDLKETE